MILALVALSLNGLWISLLPGMLSTRAFAIFRRIVTNIAQVLFFLTPIFWPLSAVGVF